MKQLKLIWMLCRRREDHPPLQKVQIEWTFIQLRVEQKTHLLLELHSFKNAVHIFNGKCEIVKASIASKKNLGFRDLFKKLHWTHEIVRGKFVVLHVCSHRMLLVSPSRTPLLLYRKRIVIERRWQHGTKALRISFCWVRKFALRKADVIHVATPH